MTNNPRPDASPEILEKIQKEYEQTLVIPAHKPTPQWMLMPVGLMAAGKTTVLKELAQRFGLIRISTDEVRKMLKERGYSYAGCRDIADNLDQKYLKLGYSLAVDANTGSPIGLQHNKKTKDAFPHVEQVFIHIDPPGEFIINKLKNYRHSWLFRGADHAVESFLAYKENFKLPDLPFVYRFDTSRSDLFEQIDESVGIIEEHLKKARLVKI